MNPQDKLNIQHHGNKAMNLLQQVEDHLFKSGCAELRELRQLTNKLQAAIKHEVYK